MFKWLSWHTAMYVLISVVSLALSAFIVYSAPKKTYNESCTETYGSHTLADPPVTCPTAKHKLVIVEKGKTIGLFEYSCKCQ